MYLLILRCGIRGCAPLDLGSIPGGGKVGGKVEGKARAEPAPADGKMVNKYASMIY